MRYIRVWIQLTRLAFSTYLSNRMDSGSYLVGKIIRFAFFWLMIVSIFRFTETMAGYTQYEVLLFFLTFNIVDVLSQAFFRGIYFFKKDIIKGTFDFALSKPNNALFFALFRMSDLLDFLFLIPIFGLLIFVLAHIPNVTLISLLLYSVFIVIGLIIQLGIHIFAAALTLRTLDSDNLVWLHRETIGIGRFPPEILSHTLQVIFTYIVPIIIAVAFPVKALLHELTSYDSIVACGVAVLFVYGSLLLWKHNLKHYSSASS